VLGADRGRRSHEVFARTEPDEAESRAPTRDPRPRAADPAAALERGSPGVPADRRPPTPDLLGKTPRAPGPSSMPPPGGSNATSRDSLRLRPDRSAGAARRRWTAGRTVIAAEPEAPIAIAAVEGTALGDPDCGSPARPIPAVGSTRQARTFYDRLGPELQLRAATGADEGGVQAARVPRGSSSWREHTGWGDAAGRRFEAQPLGAGHCPAAEPELGQVIGRGRGAARQASSAAGRT